MRLVCILTYIPMPRRKLAQLLKKRKRTCFFSMIIFSLSSSSSSSKTRLIGWANFHSLEMMMRKKMKKKWKEIELLRWFTFNTRWPIWDPFSSLQWTFRAFRWWTRISMDSRIRQRKEKCRTCHYVNLSNQCVMILFVLPITNFHWYVNSLPYLDRQKNLLYLTVVPDRSMNLRRRKKIIRKKFSFFSHSTCRVLLNWFIHNFPPISI